MLAFADHLSDRGQTCLGGRDLDHDVGTIAATVQLLRLREVSSAGGNTAFVLDLIAQATTGSVSGKPSRAH